MAEKGHLGLVKLVPMHFQFGVQLTLLVALERDLARNLDVISLPLLMDDLARKRRSRVG